VRSLEEYRTFIHNGMNTHTHTDITEKGNEVINEGLKEECTTEEKKKKQSVD
jgi:hypothetical protein